MLDLTPFVAYPCVLTCVLMKDLTPCVLCAFAFIFVFRLCDTLTRFSLLYQMR